MNSTDPRLEALPRMIIPVTMEYHIAQAQRAVQSLARSLGLSQVATYSLVTVVSELANNLFFHATCGGTITLVALRKNGQVGVEVVAVDAGPGIADLDRALEDGFSTNGGLGGGLPGVGRLMDEFEISSSADIGTRVVARKWESCG